MTTKAEKRLSQQTEELQTEPNRYMHEAEASLPSRGVPSTRGRERQRPSSVVTNSDAASGATSLRPVVAESLLIHHLSSASCLPHTVIGVGRTGVDVSAMTPSRIGR